LRGGARGAWKGKRFSEPDKEWRRARSSRAADDKTHTHTKITLVALQQQNLHHHSTQLEGAGPELGPHCTTLTKG
jgi:hypothetical protein